MPEEESSLVTEASGKIEESAETAEEETAVTAEETLKEKKDQNNNPGT